MKKIINIKQGFTDEAIIFAENMEFRSEKIMTYRDISENLALNDNFNSTVYVLKESLRINRGIKYNQKTLLFQSFQLN